MPDALLSSERNVADRCAVQMDQRDANWFLLSRGCDLLYNLKKKKYIYIYI